jgi:hypothetical protein
MLGHKPKLSGVVYAPSQKPPTWLKRSRRSFEISKGHQKMSKNQHTSKQQQQSAAGINKTQRNKLTEEG